MADAGQFTQTGHVKSWNGAKGYGFINSDAIGGDIMFSKRELPEDVREVQGKFLEGRPVAFEVVAGPDGRMKASAMQVLVVEGKPLAGLIKSWSDRNGYGFITSSSLQEDLRFARQDMPQAPGGVHLQGQLVTFHIKTRPDGKLMANNVHFQSGQTAQRLGAAMLQGSSPGQITPIYPGKGGGKGHSVGFTHDAGQSSGMVKSYSERNRYGFINVPGQQGDIKFGQGDLADPSYTPQPGTQVSFSLMVSPDGRVQAKGVKPGGGGAKRGVIMPGPEAKRPRPLGAGGKGCGGKGGEYGAGNGGGSVPTGQYIRGTVKSFNALKGFGFISSDETPGDVYFGAAMLSAEVQPYISDLVGQAITCQLSVAPDGKIRAQNITMG